MLVESESIRAISETIKESPFRNLLLKCVVDVEQRSPGSSLVALSVLSGAKVENEISGLRFSIQQLHSSLNFLIGKECADIVMQAITIAGRKGKILIDGNESQATEISYGTQICRWKPELSYFTAVGQSKISVQDCRVIFIDGIIETVSECHRLFNDSYEKSIPIVIFARGFSEEVIATAAINMQRKTAQVIPILIPFDEVGVNGMGDLAGCFSAELISSDKGQLISNVDLSSCVHANRISCSHLGTEIEFKDSRTMLVVQKLMSKLQVGEQQQSDLVRRRLDALGSNAVTIRIGSERKSICGIQRDRIDFGIRYVRSCMIQGVTSFNNLMLPAKSVKLGYECSNSFQKLLQRSNLVLEVDRCG